MNPLYNPPEAYAEAKKSTDRPHVASLIPAFVTSPHLFGYVIAFSDFVS